MVQTSQRQNLLLACRGGERVTCTLHVRACVRLGACVWYVRACVCVSVSVCEFSPERKVLNVRFAFVTTGVRTPGGCRIDMRRGSQPRTPMMNEQGPVFSDYISISSSPPLLSCNTHVHTHVRSKKNFFFFFFCLGGPHLYTHSKISTEFAKPKTLLSSTTHFKYVVKKSRRLSSSCQTTRERKGQALPYSPLPIPS